MSKVKNILHILLYIAALSILAIGAVKMIKSYSPMPGNIEVNKRHYDSIQHTLKTQHEIIKILSSDTDLLDMVQQDTLYAGYLKRFHD